MKPEHCDIVFRTDGGLKYGVAMGHVYRCKRLAEHLRTKGVSCHFIMKNMVAGLKLIQDAGFPVTVLGDGGTIKENALSTVDWIKTLEGFALFVDLRHESTELVEAAVNRDIYTIVYEDIFLTKYEPDLLFNPSPVPVNYGFDPSRLCLGLDYLILGNEYENFAVKPFSYVIQNILVSFGGADPCNFSERITDLLLSRNDHFNVHIVLGAAYGFSKEIEEKIARHDSKGRFFIHHNIKSLFELGMSCDASIISGGTTMYEMISMCVPGLVLPTIDHEARLARCLIEKVLVDGIDEDVNNVPDKKLETKVNDFLSSFHLRKECHANSSRFNLKSGTSRVSSKICRFLVNEGHHDR